MDLGALAGGSIVRSVGVGVGQLLGKKLVLGGCRDDLPDDLDERAFVPEVSGARLPGSVDLRRWMTPVEDQGSLGSCTSNALASAVEYLLHRQGGTPVDVSRLFMYYNQRLWGGTVREDSGAHIGWGIRVLSRLGVCSETMWPYSLDLFAVQPPRAVYEAAAEHRIVGYHNVPIDRLAMRAALATGFPVAFGTQLFEEFMELPESGTVPMPSGNVHEGKHGRHAMLVVGYDDAEELFIVRNSWGEEFGDRGYCYIPYAYLLNGEWTRNAFIVRCAADVTFEADDHVTGHLAAMPKAPPPDQAISSVTGISSLIGVVRGGAGVDLAAGLATKHAGSMVSLITGSAIAGQLFGGVVQGLAPAVRSWTQRTDNGAALGDDQSEQVLAVLRGSAADLPAQRATWDDGVDEESARGAAPVAHAPVAAPPATDFAWLPPATGAAWRASGGPRGPLGSPLPPMKRVAAAGRDLDWVMFERGSAIDWHPVAGEPDRPPFALYDGELTYERWKRLGGPGSPVGWPVHAPSQASDGIGTIMPCTEGAIVHRGDLGTFFITGAIFAHWFSHGALTGARSLGYPISDEGGGACSFERGTIRLVADSNANGNGKTRAHVAWHDQS